MNDLFPFIECITCPAFAESRVGEFCDGFGLKSGALDDERHGSEFLHDEDCAGSG
jgi:hypothetical protein